ncbi:hypothetical protein ACX12E_19000 [Paenibacillus vandeheii]
MSKPEFVQAVNEVREVTQQIHEHYEKHGYTLLLELHTKLLTNKKLLAEFEKDPLLRSIPERTQSSLPK